MSARNGKGGGTARSPLASGELSGTVIRATFRAQIVEQLREAIIRGDIPPGGQVTEALVASRFGVSRGPLREAMSQLIEEGLLVCVPYTGTHVIGLSREDVREIYSMRSVLETFAFREIWDQRSSKFKAELVQRHDTLLKTLRKADSFETTRAEVRLHSLVYETCGHKLLMETWRRLSGRMQLYLAVHQRAHDRSAPLKDAHERYVRLAQGHRLDLMIAEIEHHMRRGVAQLEAFIAAADAPSSSQQMAKPRGDSPASQRRRRERA